jgi:hypothetical protein
MTNDDRTSCPSETAPRSAAKDAGGRGRWALLALLGVLLLGVYLRWTPRALVQDQRPWPDGLEYEEGAQSLAAGRGYLLWIGNRAYPPRYVPGLSLLIAASLPLVGDAPGSGIWVVLAGAVAAMAGTYVLVRGAAGPAAGLVAALLVATSPLHVSWSRAVMSDVPASAAVAWLAAWIVALVRRRAGAAESAALGLACGLVVSLRPPLAVLAPAAGAAVVLLSPDPLQARLRNVIALGCGAAVGVLPLLWLDATLFGSPLHTGYGYWAPKAAFSVGRVTATAVNRPSNLSVYGPVLVGDGALYPWPAAILLLAGAVVGLRRGGAVRKLVLVCLLVIVLFVSLHLGYSGRADRLFLSILPLFAAIMAVPLAAGSARTLRAGALVLVAATLLLEARQQDAFAPPNRPYFDVATLERIAAVAEPNAAIVASTNPFSFARVLRRDGADRIWVPLRLDPHQLAIRVQHLVPVRRDDASRSWIARPITLPLDRRAALATVDALCREGRPVYLSEQRRGELRLLGRLERALGARHSLTAVVPAKPFAVYRVACDPASEVGATRPGRAG